MISLPRPFQTSATDFYMLVASLPHMPRTFEAAEPPISRLRLQQRLRLLSPHEASVVDQVQGFLRWDRQQAARTDAEVQDEYQRLMRTISNPLVRGIIAYRMDVRTITSALRRRRRGLPPPTGVGQWVEHLQRHWDHPHFLLSREHPWIPVVIRNLEVGRPLEVERQLLLATWNRWIRLADQYHFSLETILLYLARWEIVDRWSRLNAELGRQRFDTLLAEAIGDHVHS